MSKTIPLLTLYLITFCTVSGYAQFPKQSFGIRAGITSSYIGNLDKTIVSEPYFVNYTLKKQTVTGIYLGAFYNLSVLPTPGTTAENVTDTSWKRGWLFQSHLVFAREGSELLFNNYEKDFNYKMRFDYSYVLAGCDMKYYFLGKVSTKSGSKWRDIFKGLNAGMGIQIGFNTSPDKITYSSWGTGREPVFDSDIVEQKKLRDVLKGKGITGISVIGGYDIITTKGDHYKNSGISIEARVFAGLKDAVKTEANTYNFIENKNFHFATQLTVAIDMAKLFK